MPNVQKSAIASVLGSLNNSSSIATATKLAGKTLKDVDWDRLFNLIKKLTRSTFTAKDLMICGKHICNSDSKLNWLYKNNILERVNYRKHSTVNWKFTACGIEVIKETDKLLAELRATESTTLAIHTAIKQ